HRHGRQRLRPARGTGGRGLVRRRAPRRGARRRCARCSSHRRRAARSCGWIRHGLRALGVGRRADPAGRLRGLARQGACRPSAGRNDARLRHDPGARLSEKDKEGRKYMAIDFRPALAGGLCAILLAGAAQSVAAKELKLATFLPPTHPIVGMYEQLGKDVAQETNGDLTIKVYAGGALGAGPFQQYKRAVEGVADIADICHAFHAKVFAKTMLIVQPGAATTGTAAPNRLWAVPEATMASDYKEVKNVHMYSVPQATLISRDKPVRTMADLKGLKVMTPGAAFSPIVASWGAS